MILQHMCAKCEHSAENHTGHDCSYGGCRCRSKTFDPEPTLVPTRDEFGQPVLTVTPPGTKWPERGRGFITCACDACQAKHADLMGVPA